MTRRHPLLWFVSIAALVAAGCAGGWRGGAAPAEWAASANPAPAAATATAAAKSGGAASGTSTHAVADGAEFVWSGEGGAVNVAGEFNAWSTSADPLKKGADGAWRLVKPLPPGRYAYKFVIDGTNWKPDPGAPEGVDDGFGGKNSVVVVGAAGAAAPAPSAPKPAAASAGAGAGATVTADGAVFRYAGPANSVNVAGDFNSWSTSADPMVKQADGTWALTKPLPPGRSTYKFVVDGTNWKEDPNATETVDDGFGGKNAVLVVGAAGAGGAPAVSAPAAATSAPTATKPLAPGAKPRAPQLTPGGVVFTYAGPAKNVTLAGEFNSWGTSADPMTQQADGTWTITKKLAPGTYGYKFLIDGTSWKQDDGNPAAQDDGFGGKNSIVVVK